MLKVLFAGLHRPGRSPSQRYRFEQFLEYFKMKGIDCHYFYLLNAAGDRSFYAKGKYLQKTWILLKSVQKLLREVRHAGNFDIVMVQRECFMLGTSWFEKKFAGKAKLVFDFDDSIWLQTVSENNRSLSFLKNADKTKEIIKIADLVIAGNQYLAGYASQFSSKVVVIPTTIDTLKYQPVSKENLSVVCIGWTGSFSTLQHFSLAIPFLKKIKEKYGKRVRFKIIGEGSYYCHELETAGTTWREATEVRDLLEIDIGIMPLPDDDWSRGKCGMKGLQYMALAIPTLMSPVGVNKEILQHGVNGFLPCNEEEWIKYISMLVEDASLRKQIGEAGRKTVEEKYSVDAWKDKYLDLFEKIAPRKNN